MAGMSDHELLGRIKHAKNIEELNQLMIILQERWHGRFYTIARERLEREDAEEAVNDAFANIARSRATYKEKGPDTAQGWLIMVCKHALIDRLRVVRRRRRLQQTPFNPEQDPRDIGAVSPEDRALFRECWNAALATLTQEERTIFLAGLRGEVKRTDQDQWRKVRKKFLDTFDPCVPPWLRVRRRKSKGRSQERSS